MKKFIMFVLALALCLSMLSFAACYDDSALAGKIAELEKTNQRLELQLAGIDKGAPGEKGDTGDPGTAGAQGAQGEKGETGAPGEKGEIGIAGPQGPAGDKGDRGDAGAVGEKGDTGDVGPAGPQGPAGSGAYDDSALLERIAELESLLNPVETPVYELGETFTYVSAGIPLFSIKVEITEAHPDSYTLTITNINMTNAQRDSYIRCRSRSVLSSWASGLGVGTSRLNIGETYTNRELISFHNSPYALTHFYFGIPVGTNDIIPYAIFKVHP